MGETQLCFSLFFTGFQSHSTETNNSMDICTYLKGQRSYQKSQKILHKYNKIQMTV